MGIAVVQGQDKRKGMYTCFCSFGVSVSVVHRKKFLFFGVSISYSSGLELDW